MNRHRIYCIYNELPKQTAILIQHDGLKMPLFIVECYKMRSLICVHLMRCIICECLSYVCVFFSSFAHSAPFCIVFVWIASDWTEKDIIHEILKKKNSFYVCRLEPFLIHMCDFRLNFLCVLEWRTEFARQCPLFLVCIVCTRFSSYNAFWRRDFRKWAFWTMAENLFGKNFTRKINPNTNEPTEKKHTHANEKNKNAL